MRHPRLPLAPLALDKQALLRVVVRFGEDPTEVMFLLEDAVTKAQAVAAQ